MADEVPLTAPVITAPADLADDDFELAPVVDGLGSTVTVMTGYEVGLMEELPSHSPQDSDEEDPTTELTAVLTAVTVTGYTVVFTVVIVVRRPGAVEQAVVIVSVIVTVT